MSTRELDRMRRLEHKQLRPATIRTKERKFWYQVKEIRIRLMLHNLTKALQ